MRPDLPQLLLSVRPGPRGAPLRPVTAADAEGPGVALLAAGQHPAPLRFQTGERDLVVFGTPFLEDASDRLNVARRIADSEDPTEAVARLNGEFGLILHDTREGTLDLFTDRHGSWPFFWAARPDVFCASGIYTDLARTIRDWPGFRLRPEKAYEFLTLQRLMGGETHDTLSTCMPAGARLRLRVGETIGVPETIRYWTPFRVPKRKDSLSQQAELFVPLLRQAVKRRVPPGEGARTGLFLSGGHDARLVAAYAPEKITCYTLGLTDNYEVACARRVAHSCGHAHEYLNVPDDYFTRTLERTSWMGGGMYATDHSLFLPVPGRTPLSSRMFMNGFALDFFFHGTYLNARTVSLLGRPTFFRRMLPYPDDLAGYFLKTASFRLKYDLDNSLVRRGHCDDLRRALHETVAAVVEEGRRFSDDTGDVWDYILFHNLARHFTFGNIFSMRLNGEVRSPCIDRDLYDFVFSLPREHRLHSALPRAAMWRHGRDIAMLPTGNFAMPAGFGPLARTSFLIGRKILRDATGSKRFVGPQPEDRTWPDRRSYMASHDEYWQAALEPLGDPAFRDMLDFLDWEAMAADPAAIRDAPGGAAFWIYLLSYYRFYKAVM